MVTLGALRGSSGLRSMGLLEAGNSVYELIKQASEMLMWKETGHTDLTKGAPSTELIWKERTTSGKMPSDLHT